jgi:hypothetical protein
MNFALPPRHLLSALVVLFLLSSCASLDKKNKFSITFHAMATENDPKKTMFPVQMEGRSLLFKLVPEVSQENITAFHTFNSEDGKSNGVTLKLDFRGAGALEIVTRNPPGEYLLAMVNGEPVDYLTLDQIISDGIITIWQGVSDQVIKEMDKKLPRLTSEGGPSMSRDMEMSPIFKKEKHDAYEAAKAREKQEKQNAKTGKKEEIMQMPVLPQAKPTNRIPVEGGSAPLPGVPPGGLPLPKP